MRVRVGIGMACAGVMIVTAAFAADLKSGPQPGAKISAFHPLNVTGDDAGNKRCLV